MKELEGRTGIVTGGSSGIGYAIANTLAQAGAKVYAISRSGAVKSGAQRRRRDSCAGRCDGRRAHG